MSQLLRIATAGSVDDGKSTLIGRLLHDTKSIFEDQLSAIEQTSVKRSCVIAATPGHIQYTRNMVTGASTASLALLLVDARKGVLEQTRRHALLSSLLGVPHLVLCVNKMDLVDYDQNVYD